MLYSKTFCLRLGSVPQTLILLATLLLSCQLGIAQTNKQPNDLIGGDMGLPSSDADNSLIDTDTIAPTASEPSISPAEAAELVRNKVGGQVMSVNTQQDDTGVVYGVKVLNAGRMRVINVDGQTGQLLNH
ncbi:PepSY domain-containing protein [Cellvibrio sp.]